MEPGGWTFAENLGRLLGVLEGNYSLDGYKKWTHIANRSAIFDFCGGAAPKNMAFLYNLFRLRAHILGFLSPLPRIPKNIPVHFADHKCSQKKTLILSSLFYSVKRIKSMIYML